MKKTATIILSLVITLSLFACAPALSESAACAEIERLVTESLAVNDMFYGDALASDARLGGLGEYKFVTADAPVQSTEEMKASARKVFTEGYCEILFRSAFQGQTSEYGASYARFADNDDGRLMIYGKSEPQLSEMREYDFSTTKITSNSAARITAEISSVCGGESAVITVKIINVDGGWLLDTPTY